MKLADRGVYRSTQMEGTNCVGKVVVVSECLEQRHKHEKRQIHQKRVGTGGERCVLSEGILI